MKKRLIPLLATCLFLTGCSQLPVAREMEDMALLRTMGIDRAPGGVAVTGSTGPRARGLQGEGEPALTLSADRESLSGACLAMKGQSDSFVFFGYVDQLLIGEELAREGVQPVLDYFARDAELGLGAQFWLIRGASAREAVSAGGDKGVDSRLETLQHDSKMGISSHTRTAGELYTDLLEFGSAFVPALVPAESGAAILAEQGYGVLNGDKLAGFLDGEAAKGLELLAGGPSADILETELAHRAASVKVTSARTGSRMEFQGDTPSVLKLTCNIEARLSEYGDRLTEEEVDQLRRLAETIERSRLEAALARLKELHGDCVGLGAKAAMFHPVQWQKIQASWPDWFSRIPIDIKVQIRIDT